jgi:hypothetical protein
MMMGRPLHESLRLITESITDEGCWLVRRENRRKDGYGWVSHEGRIHLAHRLAWKDVAGEIPSGLFVLHTCDNHSCIRNDDEGTYEVGGVILPRRGHLFVGTQRDNLEDMTRKGRRRNQHSKAPGGYDVAVQYYRTHSSPGRTSQHRGVCLIQGRWVAQIRFMKRRYRIGTYDTEEEAALAVSRKRLELTGPLLAEEPLLIFRKP